MTTKEALLNAGKMLLKHMLNGGAQEKTTSKSASVKDYLPPGVVREGEKVIAIQTNLNEDEDNIIRGEVLTVRRYHLDSYCFE